MLGSQRGFGRLLHKNIFASTFENERLEIIEGCLNYFARARRGDVRARYSKFAAMRAWSSAPRKLMIAFQMNIVPCLVI